MCRPLYRPTLSPGACYLAGVQGGDFCAYFSIRDVDSKKEARIAARTSGRGCFRVSSARADDDSDDSRRSASHGEAAEVARDPGTWARYVEHVPGSRADDAVHT